MDSDSSSYASSTIPSSIGDVEIVAAPALPDEEAMQRLFNVLCAEVCLAFWMRARADQHVRRVGREAVQYRRRFSRMELSEILTSRSFMGSCNLFTGFSIRRRSGFS